MEDKNKTLNEILESIDEVAHLSDLIKHRSRDMRGASATEIMNKVIHPTLDDLELYLRYYGNPSLSSAELKKLVHEWIEAQMTI
ncbi:MAG: hypothetical protein JW931_03920 [Methanomicrobiaceae archaeon]|nr:hypothetical protein [Methanomicrobiaceae archaeon]